MRKILFVSSAPLSLETFDGKEKRALSILKSLSKKNKIDPKITHRIWKSIIGAYIDYEFRNFKKK